MKTILSAFGLAVLTIASARAGDPAIESTMYHDPIVPAAKQLRVFPSELPGLWLQYLNRPDADSRCKAAAAVATAKRKGMAGLESFVPPLLRELEPADRHATVRLTAAQALVALDAKSAAPNLFKALDVNDPELREVIEPALARWDYAPARTAWLARLAEPPPHRRSFVLAIQALATLKEDKAAPRLRELAIDAGTSATVRVEAARALATLKNTGSEADAEKLAASKSHVDRLVAALILAKHSGDATVAVLAKLGIDVEPAVAAPALARLIELDSKYVVPLLDSVLSSADANVRAHGVTVLHRQPSDKHVTRLGDRLVDGHPDVRAQARKALLDLAGKAEWQAGAIREGTRQLGGNDWRGQEQAAILLAQLDHKPATDRLLALLPGRRPESVIAAAWALRKLAVPETLAPILEFVKGQHAQINKSATRDGIKPEEQDEQLSQLIQFLGKSKYQPSAVTLLAMAQFVVNGMPTRVIGEARAASMYGLGYLNEGNPNAAVAGYMAQRLAAVNPFDTEDNRVRQMCAMSLGRMKAVNQVGTIRTFYGAKKPHLDPVNNACGWALEQITGEKQPAPGLVEENDVEWFAGPVRDPKE